MARLAVLLSILMLLGAGAAWAVNVSADRTRLESELQQTVQANRSYIDAIAVLDRQQRDLEQSIIDRDRRARAIQNELNTTKRRLFDASKMPSITYVERECMESGIPVPVLDLLRETGRGVPNKPTSQNLPTGYSLFANTGPDIHGSNLVGPCGSCDRTQVAHSTIEPGPAGN